MKKNIDQIDKKVTDWMKFHGDTILRYAVALIFIWFGTLKIVGSSPAGELVAQTVYWFSPNLFVPFLGVWEVSIGLLFLYKPLLRVALLLLAPQMVGTFLPLVLLPEVVYSGHLFGLTVEGQYIVKNIVIIGAALVIGSHVRDRN